MIEWLVVSAENNTQIAAGIPPVGLFSVAERRAFDLLRTEKRRRDRLVGRWAMKRLLQTVLQENGCDLPLDRLEIGNRDSGEPFLNGQQSIADGQWSISISHSDGVAFCGVADGMDFGVDIERVEARSDEFINDYFTLTEQQIVADTPPSDRDLAVTTVWSAKEAALKALRLGLRVDTRAVECRIGFCEGEQSAWQKFRIEIMRPLPGMESLHRAAQPHLTGWWRRMGSFVLTMAAVEGPSRI